MKLLLFFAIFIVWTSAGALTGKENINPRYLVEWVEEPQEGSAPRPLIFRFGEHQRAFDWEREHPGPSCVGMENEARQLCIRVRNAQRIARDVPLQVFFSKTNSLGLRVSQHIRRELTLVVYSESDNTFHTILLDMPVNTPGVEDLVVRTAEFEVIRQRGTTLNQMVFEVRRGGERLMLLAAKHLVIPVGVSRSSLLMLKLKTEPTVYLATPDELNTAGFERAGYVYAKEHLLEALHALREKRVPSRAFPGKLVTDVVSVDLLMRLIAIEQADPWRMFGERYDRLLTDNGERVMSGVFVRFFLNGLRAYHYICSDKHACGTFQFTNHTQVPGTYDTVRMKYPEAKLDPQYVRGALSFINGAEAAACLIDLELANQALPAFVRELYLQNPVLGALFPIAAYNGGASQSIALAKLFERHKREFKKDMTLENIPWNWEPLKKSVYTKNQGPLKQETAVYLRKYQVVERYFRERVTK